MSSISARWNRDHVTFNVWWTKKECKSLDLSQMDTMRPNKTLEDLSSIVTLRDSHSSHILQRQCFSFHSWNESRDNMRIYLLCKQESFREQIDNYSFPYLLASEEEHCCLVPKTQTYQSSANTQTPCAQNKKKRKETTSHLLIASSESTLTPFLYSELPPKEAPSQ